MRTPPWIPLLILTGLVGLCAGMALAAGRQAPAGGAALSPDTRQSTDFFEREVRPLLLTECGSCHGAALRQGGLRLDGRAHVLRGGGRGPAVVPGRPERSLLLQAVRHHGLKMPPGRQLPDAQVRTLESWIRMGAPWPEREAASEPASPAGHWAFRPVRRAPLPRLRNRAPASRPVHNPIDAFILARLERAGLSASPEAGRPTLLRRLHYDLIGLPPTPEEVEAFTADRSPDALEKVVDRLLASPHYGERWGRHWLDVARYADTKDGVLMFGDSRIRPHAYTYRDYVIRALNTDTPYDRFIQEQLAADQLTPPAEPWRLAAMGFLTLGRVFDNNLHDQIDDQIDTVSRGFLGLTVSCARCHDHKYDPIPTADYYSLYGVFASSEAPLELPVIGRAGDEAGRAAYEKEYLPKKQQLIDHLDTQFALLSETARERAGDYLVHVATTEPDPLETAIFFLSLSPEDLRPQIVARWRRLLERRARPEDPVFGPWRELMDSSARGGASACRDVLTRWRRRAPGTAPGQANPLVLRALDGAPLADPESIARAYSALLGRAYRESRQADARPDAARDQILELVAGPESPGYFRKSHTYYYMSRKEKDAFNGLRQELDRIAVRHAAAPPRAMVLHDAPDLHHPRIFVRGNAGQPGEAVPRRFLKVLAGDARRPFPHGSGRLDLARAIADPANPLTARVLVNRVWMHHFGEPLVATPGDFGLRSTPPSHPELLDFLAAAFTAPAETEWTAGRNGEWVSVPAGAPYRAGSPRWSGAGWSLKRLHRLLVLSAAYRQSSADRAVCRARDPENRLLWRAHRRRLDFEQVRDTLLSVSGRLDRTPGGRPAPDAMDPGSRRRTVYSLVDRQSLPEVFRTFNFPQPDQSVERRPSTTVPQQALFGLNSRFMLEQARGLAARPEVAGTTAPEARVRALYRLLHARPPHPDELEAGLEFVRGAEAGDGRLPNAGPWEQYAHVLLLTNELMFLD